MPGSVPGGSQMFRKIKFGMKKFRSKKKSREIFFEMKKSIDIFFEEKYFLENFFSRWKNINEHFGNPKFQNVEFSNFENSGNVEIFWNFDFEKKYEKKVTWFYFLFFIEIMLILSSLHSSNLVVLLDTIHLLSDIESKIGKSWKSSKKGFSLDCYQCVNIQMDTNANLMKIHDSSTTKSRYFQFIQDFARAVRTVPQ